MRHSQIFDQFISQNVFRDLLVLFFIFVFFPFFFVRSIIYSDENTICVIVMSVLSSVLHHLSFSCWCPSIVSLVGWCCYHPAALGCCSFQPPCSLLPFLGVAAVSLLLGGALPPQTLGGVAFTSCHRRRRRRHHHPKEGGEGTPEGQDGG